MASNNADREENGDTKMRIFEVDISEISKRNASFNKDREIQNLQDKLFSGTMTESQYFVEVKNLRSQK